MQNRTINILALFVLLFALASFGEAQNSDSVTYHINLDAGIGPSVHLTDVNFEGQQTAQFIFTCRLMWEPEHLLRVGIESGFIQLYHLDTKIYDSVFGSTNSLINMSSVPVIAVFSMEVADNLEFIGGIGGFIITSEVTSFDNYVRSSSWSNAYEFGLSYLHPINNKLKLGAELKTYYITHLENYDVALQFSLKYSIFSY
jgi:hypothetical protein